MCTYDIELIGYVYICYRAHSLCVHVVYSSYYMFTYVIELIGYVYICYRAHSLCVHMLYSS